MAAQVYICWGSSCQKHKETNRKLEAALEPVVPVKRVKCQKICKGPVVGVRRGSKLRWFRRCRDKSDREALVLVASGGKAPRSLRGKTATKRAGKLR